MSAVWDEDPPATARAALQTCVLRLRKLCTKYGISTTTIEAVPGGYRTHNDAETTLDLALCRAQASQAPAAGGPGEELCRLGEVLSLWHGPRLADVAPRTLRRDAVRSLEQERLRVPERRATVGPAPGTVAAPAAKPAARPPASTPGPSRTAAAPGALPVPTARVARPAADSGWRGVPRKGSGRPGLAPVPGFAGREATATIGWPRRSTGGGRSRGCTGIRCARTGGAGPARW
ncbi:BTAD domain-containing putative transcriptional regulator [Streptomyces sp. 2132.2]|uniref:AfsR/SARP family transcriptional regulator n=1 Tax=Streptomyces sp. 2132.2 TaxID=2485161 RepID=UPI0037DA4DC7